MILVELFGSDLNFFICWSAMDSNRNPMINNTIAKATKMKEPLLGVTTKDQKNGPRNDRLKHALKHKDSEVTDHSPVSLRGTSHFYIPIILTVS